MTGRPGRRRCVLTLVALLGVLGGLVLAAPAASAHAYVLATTPSNGAEVQTAPTRIQVTFDEPVTLPSTKGAASVVDAAGKGVDDGSVRLTGGRRTLVIGIRPGVAKGSYVASWSVVSADTHPVGGSVQFGYGVPAVAIAAPPSEQPSAGLELVVGVVKGLLYLGLVAAFGLLPAGFVLGADAGERRTLWRVARTGAALSVLASSAQIVTQYLWDASAVPGGATRDGLRAFAGSGYSEAVYVRVGLLAAALAALPPLRALGAGRPVLTAWWSAEGALALAALGSVVHNGHGGTGARWYFVSTLVHVSAAVAWIGGLAVLGWLVLRRRLSLARFERLPVWSRYAATSVGLLALAGVLQGLVQVRYPGALFSTTYGCVLIVKLVLVAAALLLGLRGNRWIARQVARREEYAADGRVAPGETARLRGRVRAEAGIGALIVVVAGVLSSVEPARTAYDPTCVVHAMIGPYSVTIEVAPARRGPQSFRITAEGATDTTAPPRSVQLVLGQAAGAVRALPVGFPYRLPGPVRAGKATAFTFVSSSVNVPGTGPWTGTLTLVASATEQYTDAFHYRVL